MYQEPQIGGSNAAAQLARMRFRGDGVEGITRNEFEHRVRAVQARMRDQQLAALVLIAGSNLAYFTGLHGHASERLTAAVIPLEGPIFWITPEFEAPKLRLSVGPECEILTWVEEEDPFAILAARLGPSGSQIAMDDTAPYWMVDRLGRALGMRGCVPARELTSYLRQRKSHGEIQLIKNAMELTLEVHRAAARILQPGITAREVTDFIDEAHRVIAGARSVFCIVSFGEATAYPHGGPDHQVLSAGDMVLIDTGTQLHGYNSDITRSYVFGEASAKQRRVWSLEKQAQYAAFEAARLGRPCEAVDAAARDFLTAQGFGPDYSVPGLPHRTGHGLGLDLHEEPYLVRGDKTLLAPGMCFSNEPMICIYGEFGVRLEDHFYMSVEGPEWFTLPARTIDRPFID